MDEFLEEWHSTLDEVAEEIDIRVEEQDEEVADEGIDFEAVEDAGRSEDRSSCQSCRRSEG